MPTKVPLTIDEAKRLVEQWQGIYEDHQEHQALRTRFGDASPAEVVKMWEAGRNEKGKPLTKFEVRALAECWGAIFGTMPPCDEAMPAPVQPVEPEPDGPLLTMRDVVRMTTTSKTTIKRWVSDNDNDFPRPVKLSPRRIAWRKKDVVAWIERRR
jgi:prophage regulatory protein